MVGRDHQQRSSNESEESPDCCAQFDHWGLAVEKVIKQKLRVISTEK